MPLEWRGITQLGENKKTAEKKEQKTSVNASGRTNKKRRPSTAQSKKMTTTTTRFKYEKLPVPSFFNPKTADEIRFVDYAKIIETGEDWQKRYNIRPGALDRKKIHAVGIDNQLTFMLAKIAGQLPVGGAIEDSVRWATWLYENLRYITCVHQTLDTHLLWQIFHWIFLVDADGNHPPANVPIDDADIQSGKWTISPKAALALYGNAAAHPELQRYLRHYSTLLKQGGKYPLIPWVIHGQLGGVEHALLPIIHEASTFHSVARSTEYKRWTKGGMPLAEAYSPLKEEVQKDHHGKPVGQKRTEFINTLLVADAVIIGGQAKSHCVRAFIGDFLDEILAKDRALAEKVYLVEDFTSPVIVPGVIDFTQPANEAFDKFRDAGMKVVRSTTPFNEWPGIEELLAA